MNIDITIHAEGAVAALKRLRTGLADRTQLHADIASEAEKFVKKEVASDNKHATANRLGAAPTNHMAKKANLIGSESDADSATLKFPSASRLRAAFGAYTVFPKNGKKYLTIPVAAEAYGKKAGDAALGDLTFMRIGPKQTPVLARAAKGAGSKSPLSVLYVLVRKAEIKEDRTLLPFDELPVLAERVATAYVDSLLEDGGGA